MNTKSVFDRDILKLQAQLSDLETEAQGLTQRTAEQRDALGAVILAGGKTATAEAEIVRASVRVDGLRAAIEKGKKDLAELQSARYEALQEAARAEFATRYQAIENTLINVLAEIMKADNQAAGWRREIVSLVELARQYKLPQETARAQNLATFYPYDAVKELAGRLIIYNRGNSLFSEVQKRSAKNGKLN